MQKAKTRAISQVPQGRGLINSSVLSNGTGHSLLFVDLDNMLIYQLSDKQTGKEESSHSGSWGRRISPSSKQSDLYGKVPGQLGLHSKTLLQENWMNK